MADHSDNRRLIGNLVRMGTIERVDAAQGTVQVRVGDIVTGHLPWLAGRAGATRIWSPPTKGEQVVLICAEGDEEAGIVLPGLFSDANATPATDGADAIHFADGAVIRYDTETHSLSAILPAGGTMQVDAAGGLTINGDVTISGRISATGEIASDTDVKTGDISLTGHRHDKVQGGGSISGGPVK